MAQWRVKGRESFLQLRNTISQGQLSMVLSKTCMVCRGLHDTASKHPVAGNWKQLFLASVPILSWSTKGKQDPASYRWGKWSQHRSFFGSSKAHNNRQKWLEGQSHCHIHTYLRQLCCAKVKLGIRLHCSI